MYKLESVDIQFLDEGKLMQVKCLLPTPEDKLSYEEEAFVWKAQGGENPFKIEIKEALSGQRIKIIYAGKAKVQLKSLTIKMHYDYSTTKYIYANGFQSWSESKLLKKEDTIKPLRKIARPIMQPYGDYSYYDYTGESGVIHSWGYTYIPLAKKRLQWIGSLDEKNAFTNFVHHSSENFLQIIRDVEGWQIEGEVLISDIFQTENNELGAFQHYSMLMNLPELKVAPAIGWTSWYHYYTKISEKIILDNLQQFKEKSIPLQIFQIDDGYQSKVGDWLEVNEKFPRGMKMIADEIKSAGFQPGIWLAPLAAEKKSKLFQEHPDWFVKNHEGKPFRIGVNPLWSMGFYALDIYHEEVRAYIKKVFLTVCRVWGFDIVKLDFLYGASLVARNGRSRAGVMADAMSLLREAVGEDKIILGCGIPMGTAVGTTDYCRIGADVHLSWDFPALKWCNNRERVSTYLAITNTINRRQYNENAFINDPDVFILRTKKQKLNKGEQFTLLLANLIFGDLIFNSDNIGDYDAETMELYTSIFPLVRRKEKMVDYATDFYKIFFQIEDRRYLALMNLGETDRLFKIPPGIYFDARSQEILSNEQTIAIQKHQSVLLHNCGAGPFSVIGSKGHFFTGSEIVKIAMHGEDIKIQLRQGLLVDPIVYLKVPKDFSGKTVNEKPFKLIQKKDFAVIEIQLQRNETVEI